MAGPVRGDRAAGGLACIPVQSQAAGWYAIAGSGIKAVADDLAKCFQGIDVGLVPRKTTVYAQMVAIPTSRGKQYAWCDADIVFQRLVEYIDAITALWHFDPQHTAPMRV